MLAMTALCRSEYVDGAGAMSRMGGEECDRRSDVVMLADGAASRNAGKGAASEVDTDDDEEGEEEEEEV